MNEEKEKQFIYQTEAVLNLLEGAIRGQLQRCQNAPDIQNMMESMQDEANQYCGIHSIIDTLSYHCLVTKFSLS